MTGCSPAASSGEALDAFGPVWIALMVAIGWPLTKSGNIMPHNGFDSGMEV